MDTSQRTYFWICQLSTTLIAQFHALLILVATFINVFYLLLFLKSDLLASFLHHHIRIKGKIGVLFLQRDSLLLAWSKHFAILWFMHNQKHKQDQYIISNFGCILVEFRVSSSYHCLSTNCRRVSFLWFCDPWNTPRTLSTTHLKPCFDFYISCYKHYKYIRCDL